MARTKQTSRKGFAPLSPAKFGSGSDGDGGGNGGGGGNEDPQPSTSHAPKPVIRSVKKRKQTAPVKRLTIEQKIRKEQRKTKVQFSKAYFAK